MEFKSIKNGKSHRTRELDCAVNQIERADEICENWFNPDMILGVTAGTSTPESTLDAVLKKLE